MAWEILHAHLTPAVHEHTSAQAKALAAGRSQSCSPFSQNNLKGPLQPSDTFSLGIQLPPPTPAQAADLATPKC